MVKDMLLNLSVRPPGGKPSGQDRRKCEGFVQLGEEVGGSCLSTMLFSEQRRNIVYF